MAVTRRGYIFCAFISSVVCVLLVVVAISSDSWIVSSAYLEGQVDYSNIRYGLFRGELALRHLGTPSYNTLYMTCLSDVSACAVSCKTEPQARQDEVRALAEGLRPNQACVSVTTIDMNNPLSGPAVISFGMYAAVTAVLFLQLALATVAAALAILNATKNPTEPIFGLPGCLWTNVVTAILGLTVLMMFGIYWATSGLNQHLALSYIAAEVFAPDPSLGYSYWLLLPAVFCSLTNVGLIELRRYLLEKDPPPPTIKVENHSDGTIFLY
ncbi:PREDICTED: uncharacterized protein LOC106116214 [Papilio xuthus]|uniref:Uncharacterized protein LOC106116214 n=1 Tax=Papilio xuthus TaxID=66420 RepID=A0AAJ7E6X6_PAPXU|nr:PREDICTED: uncharacterized protein LOC106116214 [Papilio xuthus]